METDPASTSHNGGIPSYGGALAIGHHFFYASLRGTSVIDDDGEDTQQLNIRYGTAFAFLSKTFFVAAVSSAFTQHIWRAFSLKYTKVSTIDSHFAVSSSFLPFLDCRFLVSSKVAALLAFILWTLPLAALITPATLNVVPYTKRTLISQAVPVLDVATYIGNEYDRTTVKELGDWRATIASERWATQVTFGMQIPPVPAFQPNSAYNVSFYGPSLTCQKPHGNTSHDIEAIFRRVGNQTKQTETSAAVYIGLTPFLELNTFDLSAYLSAWGFYIDRCVLGQDPDCGYNAVPTPLFNPGPTALWLKIGNESVTCSLRNTSFEVSFDSSNPLTSMDKYTFTQHDMYNTSDFRKLTTQIELALYQYSVFIQPLLNIFYGAVYFDANGSFFSFTAKDNVTLKYEQLRNMDLQRIPAEYREAINQTIINEVPPSIDEDTLTLMGNRTLGDLVEEMSRNHTLSHFALPKALLKLNIYAYKGRNLILAYTAAFGAALISVIAGLIAYAANGRKTRDASFSTILLSTRNPVLDELCKEGTQQGREWILQAKLKFGQLEVQETESEGIKSREGFGFSGQLIK
ncbi:hypothetical protein BGZ63DRAFT_408464 [Mariannaea sp. PMI_226]|nr:hypothetical protein BGZ63DRAFT_408464 [Mariannaea sp. PMI_226]